MNQNRKSFLLYEEAHNFQEMMEAIPFNDDTQAFIPLYNTLILFVSEHYHNKKHKEKCMRIEKTIQELCNEAEENVKWVLKLIDYRNKFADKVLFLVVRLTHERWCKPEFKKNDVVKLRELPTLMWFDEPFVLEGIETTNLMLIKQFFDIKLKLLKIDDKFLPAEKDKKEEKTIEFHCFPKFVLEFRDLDVAAAIAEEADKRVKQVQEGACNYDVMINVFTKMNSTNRKEFLKELEEAASGMLPFEIPIDRYPIDEDSNTEFKEIDLELDKPDIKLDIIPVERYPTSEQRREKEEQMKVPSPKPKPKRKGKGKNKKGKGEKGKEKKKKGKGGKKK